MSRESRRGQLVRDLLRETYITAPTDFGKLAEYIIAREDVARREAFMAMKEGATRVLAVYEGTQP